MLISWELYVKLQLSEAELNVYVSYLSSCGHISARNKSNILQIIERKFHVGDYPDWCDCLERSAAVTGLSGHPPGVSLVSLQSREKPRGCAGCNGKIRDRFMLQALDRYWHEDCLKCACCDCRLGRVGSTLYTRANLILCRRDYLR